MSALALSCWFRERSTRDVAPSDMAPEREGYIVHFYESTPKHMLVADEVTGTFYVLPCELVRMHVGPQKEDHH